MCSPTPPPWTVVDELEHAGPPRPGTRRAGGAQRGRRRARRSPERPHGAHGRPALDGRAGLPHPPGDARPASGRPEVGEAELSLTAVGADDPLITAPSM